MKCYFDPDRECTLVSEPGMYPEPLKCVACQIHELIGVLQPTKKKVKKEVPDK